MNYYFIDYENVHLAGFNGIESLGSNDTLLLMYSEYCSKNFPIDLLEKICVHRVNLKLYKVLSGTKNALDFQLSSYVGYIIAKSEDKDEVKGCSFYIVSKDTGYNHLIEFWKRRNVNIKLVPNLLQVHREKKAPLPITNDEPENSAEPAIIATDDKAVEPVKASAPEKSNETVKASIPEKPLKPQPAKKPKKSFEQEPSPRLSEPIIPAVSLNLPKPVNTKAAAEPKPKAAKSAPKKIDAKKTTKEELLAYLSEEEYSDEILEIINKYKTIRSIVNAFNKEFRDSQKSSAVYKKLKPLLKERKKN